MRHQGRKPRGAGAGDRRQVLAPDRLAVGECCGTAQRMAQLADVAGPGVLHQQPFRVGAEHALRAGFSVEHGGDQLAFVGAVTQRRQLQFDAGHAVVQVFAKPPFPNPRGQVLVARADELKVDRVSVFGAERRDLALVEHAQQARLQLERHVGDFVEEQRAAVGLQDLAAPAGALRAGEGAGTVAEQLGLDQRLGDARTVYGDERAACVRAGGVHGTGKHLFAGAGFAAQQHRRVACDHAPRGLEVGHEPCVFERGGRVGLAGAGQAPWRSRGRIQRARQTDLRWRHPHR